MSVNPYESPDTVGKLPPTTKKIRFTLIELLVCIGIIAILIGMLLPAVRTSGGASRRMQCSNNLKQIGLALHNYHDKYGSFPPAYTVDTEGKPLHSWRTLILPYLEEQSLYDTIDLSKPWDDPANMAAFSANLQIYRCPEGNYPASQTTYLAVVAPGGCFRPTEPRTLAEISDSKDLTLLVMEFDSKQAVHWMSPQDANEDLVLSLCGADTPAHPGGGAQAAMADASTRFLPTSTKPASLRALISIAGNDDAIAKALD